jgi:hypothetical protein
MVSCIACVLFYSAMLVHLYMKYLLKSNWGLRLYKNLHRISFILPYENNFMILRVLLDGKTFLRKCQIFFVVSLKCIQ